MKLFAISDIHADYQENKDWVFGLSDLDFKEDILILAGDISSDLNLLEKTLKMFKNKFMEVIFVPGNHDLWIEKNQNIHSLEKLTLIQKITYDLGIITEVCHFQDLSIIPLYGWYDYSFGPPSDKIKDCWMDYFACRWPIECNEKEITDFFLSINQPFLSVKNKRIVTFSHFLPRIDLMPPYIPFSKQFIYPVLGTSLLEEQIRQINSEIHVYGHSHVNVNVMKDHVRYINNAFGYPNESHIAVKKMLSIMEI